MPLGPWELAIILVIVIIIFGAGKLPEIGGALGRGIKEFKQSTREEDEELEHDQQQYGQGQYPQQPQHEPTPQYNAEHERHGQPAEHTGSGEPARKDI